MSEYIAIFTNINADSLIYPEHTFLKEAQGYKRICIMQCRDAFTIKPPVPAVCPVTL